MFELQAKMQRGCDSMMDSQNTKKKKKAGLEADQLGEQQVTSQDVKVHAYRATRQLWKLKMCENRW